MKRRLVIVGAGLAGSVLAAKLSSGFDVTVVDLLPASGPLPLPIEDVDQPARLRPHVGAGPGGTTNYWNNGLIELEDDDFAEWPIAKSDLAPFYPQAFNLLSEASYDQFRDTHGELKTKYRERGVPPALLANGLFYPRRRNNIWRLLDVPSDVKLVSGRARHFELDDAGRVRSVCVQTPDGEQRITGDVFVSCAGGLSSPLLMQATAQHNGLTHLDAAGRHYHDHPSGPLAQIKLSLPLHDLWNYTARGLNGNIWSPFVIRSHGLKFGFTFRPLFQLWPHRRRHKIKSVLIDLRNDPFNPAHYWKLASNSDDIVEVLSFKLGLRLPTTTYAVWVVAEQAPTEEVAVSHAKQDGIERIWRFDTPYQAAVQGALKELLASFGPSLEHAEIFPNAVTDLSTGAHHSGTCRMAASAEAGVCDRDAQVFGTSNLFICDGSVLPRAGYANTGLTIGALALRLSGTITERFQ